MANEEQLAILRQGVDVWNKWREDNRNVKIDLREADLKEADLMKANLRGANLRGANLREADLRGADLVGANLTETDLTRANLAEANLTMADLTRANLAEANLTQVIPSKINNITQIGKVEGSLVIGHYGLSEIGVSSNENDVSFTAFYPKEGKIETWHTLLVYAHLMHVLDDVRRDAERFRDQILAPKEIISEFTTPIKRGTTITIIPSCAGITFNPDRFAFRWMEEYHRAEFRFMADKKLANDAARGEISIYVGPIMVGTLKFAMLFNKNGVENAEDQEEHSKMYRQEDIFVSYNHKDTDVVLACKKAYKALGFNVLIDVDTLRSGQVWNDELMRMIDRATIFQLFWSKNSSRSKYCRQEWEHALKQNKDGFIRPVYWKTPLPDPPAELSKFHFSYLELDK